MKNGPQLVPKEIWKGDTQIEFQQAVVIWREGCHKNNQRRSIEQREPNPDHKNKDFDGHWMPADIRHRGESQTVIAEPLSQTVRESYTLFKFGSSKPKQISTPLVPFYLKLNKGRDLPIIVSIVPKISGENLRSPLDKTSIKKLEGYTLVGPPPLQDKSSEIGILIGNDHYGEIVMSGKVEIDKGLYLIKSKLGSILSGRTNTKHEQNYTMTVFTRATSTIQN